MKKIFHAALSASALFALGACADDAADTNDDEVLTAEETNVINEAPEPVVVDDDANADGDRVSISEDGINADIGDGDTRVRANVDNDPGLEVEVD